MNLVDHPLFQDLPETPTKVVLVEGWSFVRGSFTLVVFHQGGLTRHNVVQNVSLPPKSKVRGLQGDLNHYIVHVVVASHGVAK